MAPGQESSESDVQPRCHEDGRSISPTSEAGFGKRCHGSSSVLRAATFAFQISERQKMSLHARLLRTPATTHLSAEIHQPLHHR